VREGFIGSVGRLPRMLNLKGSADDMLKASLYDVLGPNPVLL